MLFNGKHRRRDVGDVKLVKRRPEHLRRTKAVKQNKTEDANRIKDVLKSEAHIGD